MNRSPHPPRLLAALLLTVLPPGRADEITGDLHEEFLALAARRSVLFARLWYAAQVLGLGVRAVVRRRETPRGDASMRTMLTDMRHATRSLLTRPALSALVIVTLALGIGANAAIFAVIDALILRPFTIAEVDRLVIVAETGANLGGSVQETVSPANYLDWKRQTNVFEHLAAMEFGDMNLSGGDEPERVSGFFVSADFFPALGVQPVLGRAFTRDEETRGRHQRVVLGHGLWQRRFGGDPNVVGRVIQLDSQPYEVIGVAPAGFNFPFDSQLWGALSFDAKTAERRDFRFLTVIAKLAPGKTLDDASAQMAVVGERLAQQYPEANRAHGARVTSLVDGMRDEGLGPIVVLWQAAAGFVLLIACANIANLLLARGTERQREIAVRSALGASRGRIVRAFLAESLVLALAAVPIALGVASVGLHFIRISLPPRLLRFVSGWQSMDIDLRLIAFSVAVAALTAIIFGLIPALRASRPVLTDALKDSGRSATAGRGRQRLRTALVVGEVALALPLLVASGMSTFGAYRFLNGPQGYEPDGLVVMRSVLPDPAYADANKRRQFVDSVIGRLSQLPGVTSVAAANLLPGGNSNPQRAFEIEGQPPVDPANPVLIQYRAVTPTFFETLQMPLVRGRGFTAADTAGSLEVAIISQAAAEVHFAGADPLGRRVRFGEGPWVTVVGVSGDVIHHWFDSRNRPTLYRPYAQAPNYNLGIVMRSDGDHSALMAPARAAVRAIDPAQPVFDQMSQRELLHERTSALQYVAGIMGVFGAMALLLAVIGVYSLMAFIMAQRAHEIGVRIALGARRGDVLRLTVGQAARMAGMGVAIGLLLAAGVERVMDAALNGVFAGDVRLSLALAAILLGSAVIAGYLPGRRATRIDPLRALRAD